MLRANWAGIWNPVQQIQLLDGNSIDLVQRINDGDVAAALGFQDINQVVNSGVASDGDISG